MNQPDSLKIPQKRCTCEADFTFSPTNSLYKRFKFDLILNKSVKLQFQEDVKDYILESLVFNRNIEDTLIYYIASNAPVFFTF